ncbi:ABC transporter ATP-binding protein [Cohnella pontilimi]|uniref:ABC transporter ATP-binding protein n=1 Tax=Cohnella pontilimi TaxID=2564100 RepID=A0A4U0FHF7_9BACL|nr:ABC transporter ATP-binding protein [Cohnella pontilimi]TJY44405.1 ABC transporter ATP-binding protein [Cohnella pontilimi]
MSAIQARSLNKRYGSKRGVTDLNLEVGKGEIFGFIGPNGAGKSTTIRMIMQLIAPSSGELTVLGSRITGDDPKLRSRIGYLPSEIRLYPDLTGRQALELAAGIHGIDLKKSPVLDYAERLQWDMKPKIKSYSLGNRKKLGILMSLVYEPELLVLDEPTSGLDPLVQHQFFEIVREWNASKGTTVFFSTHVLTEVERLCQRVAIIREGRLIRVSSVSELTAAGGHIVEVTFAEPGDRRDVYGLHSLDPAAAFTDGVHRMHVSDNKLQAMLGMLTDKPIADLNVRRPSLEERFMDEYRSKSSTEAGGQ